MDIKEIVKQAEQVEMHMSAIAELEAELKNRKAECRGMLTETLPGMLQEAGITEVTLTSGAIVGLRQIFAVSMPAPGTVAKAKPDRRKELQKRVTACVNWLKKNKGAALVKHIITVDFDAGSEKDARALFAELRKRKFKPSGVKSVNAMSLKAFLKEKWLNDVEIPVELFETYTGQEAEINLPKPLKKGK